MDEGAGGDSGLHEAVEEAVADLGELVDVEDEPVLSDFRVEDVG